MTRTRRTAPAVKQTAQGESASGFAPEKSHIRSLLGRTQGAALKPNLRSTMEMRFRHDFSRVRVHTGRRAAQVATWLGAQAFTVGHDVVFGAGHYAPGTTLGRQLIAHELTHVVQQAHSRTAPRRLVNRPEDAAERQARDVERASVPFHGLLAVPSAVIQRQKAATASKPVVVWDPGAKVWRIVLTGVPGAPRGEVGVGFIRPPSGKKGAKPVVTGGAGQGEANVHIQLPEGIRMQDVTLHKGLHQSFAKSGVGVAEYAPPMSAPREERPGTHPLEMGDDASPGFGEVPWDASAPFPTVKIQPIRPSVAPAPKGFIANIFKFQQQVQRALGVQRHPTAFERTLYTEDKVELKNPNNAYPYERDAKDVRPVGDPQTGDIIGYVYESGGFTQIVDLNGIIVQQGEVPIESSLIQADDLLLPFSFVSKRLGLAALKGGAVLLRGTAQKVANPVLRHLRAVAVASMLGSAEAAPMLGGKLSVKPLIALENKVSKEVAEGGAEMLSKEVAGEGASLHTAADEAFDTSFHATFSQQATQQGLYQTTQRLVRGNLGERLAAEALAEEGHQILIYKPSILGTNQGGIDIVSLVDDVVYFVDNKALTRSGNVSSVTALTTNFSKNLTAVRGELAAALADTNRSAAERALLQKALDSIDARTYVRAVTNANVAPDSKILTGVTAGLAQKGIRFIDVVR